MKLFIFKPEDFSPLIFVVTKLESQESVNRLENMTDEIFQILVEQGEANNTNILIFSIIKDHMKSTINMILPAINSNKKMVDKCHKNTQFVNAMIVQILQNYFCEFYFNIDMEEITIYHERMNISQLIGYYSVSKLL
jgi:hypothetical protein